MLIKLADSWLEQLRSEDMPEARNQVNNVKAFLRYQEELGQADDILQRLNRIPDMNQTASNMHLTFVFADLLQEANQPAKALQLINLGINRADQESLRKPIYAEMYLLQAFLLEERGEDKQKKLDAIENFLQCLSNTPDETLASELHSIDIPTFESATNFFFDLLKQDPENDRFIDIIGSLTTAALKLRTSPIFFEGPLTQDQRVLPELPMNVQSAFVLAAIYLGKPDFIQRVRERPRTLYDDGFRAVAESTAYIATLGMSYLAKSRDQRNSATAKDHLLEFDYLSSESSDLNDFTKAVLALPQSYEAVSLLDLLEQDLQSEDKAIAQPRLETIFSWLLGNSNELVTAYAETASALYGLNVQKVKPPEVTLQLKPDATFRENLWHLVHGTRVLGKALGLDGPTFSTELGFQSIALAETLEVQSQKGL